MMRPSNNGNGRHSEPRRYRVPFNKGDYLVTVDTFAEEVDGPHPQAKSGYKYAVEGRRSIHVFSDYASAIRFAEEAIEQMSEDLGEDE
jgi:hypothetical protein